MSSGVLRMHPYTQQLANTPDEIYEIFKKTNPTAAWAIDLARAAMEEDYG